MDIQKCGQKKHSFSWRRKNVPTEKKNGYCVDPPSVSQNYEYLPSSLSAYGTKGIVDQKWKWIADSIDCTDGNSFSVEKLLVVNLFAVSLYE